MLPDDKTRPPASKEQRETFYLNFDRIFYKLIAVKCENCLTDYEGTQGQVIKCSCGNLVEIK